MKKFGVDCDVRRVGKLRRLRELRAEGNKKRTWTVGYYKYSLSKKPGEAHLHKVTAAIHTASLGGKTASLLHFIACSGYRKRQLARLDDSARPGPETLLMCHMIAE